MAEEPVHRRRRVAHACDHCREIKAKCDGQQPVCSRCAGYSYPCRWNKVRINRRTRSRSPPSGVPEGEVKLLTAKLHCLDRLLHGVRGRLSEADRNCLDIELSALQYADSEGGAWVDAMTPLSRQKEQDLSPRYLGEASDIRFYNTVRNSLCSPGGDAFNSPDAAGSQDCSYDQEKPILDLKNRDLSAILPSKSTADNFVEVYLTTIHIAYPFVCVPRFEEAHNEWWQSGKTAEITKSLLCKLT